ncbi:MAG TPA: VWA domain-containing protein [Terriglobales bacterium]|nr:VWA domain-containing protein [Terriglobales bacterium]
MGKEQTVRSFSFEASDVSDDTGRKRYVVILFDGSTMSFNEQERSRAAALQFLANSADTNQFIAIANFKSTLQITQNFTRNGERLNQAVIGSAAAKTGKDETPEVTFAGRLTVQGDFRARTMLLALRSLAKDMASVPGRKSVILLSAGFPLTPALTAELTAAIDACNKANVAIYPIDARGLLVGLPAITSSLHALPSNLARIPPKLVQTEARSSNRLAFMPASYRLGLNAMFQRPVGGAGQRPGGTPGGQQPGGNRSSSPPPRKAGDVTPDMAGNPYKQPSRLLPWFSGAGGSDNQRLLYALAEGTGGFVILNSNDLLGGLTRIGKEQNEVYMLGYTPAPSEAGSCHTLKVKVARKDAIVRARSGYCTVAPLDALTGTPVQNQLERQLTALPTQQTAASMTTAVFYTAANTARVTLAMEIPPSAMKFSTEKGKEYAGLDVLGVAYNRDASVAARFSDSVKVSFENKKDLEGFKNKLFHYEKQFEIASGQYDFKVVFSSTNESFGRLETPLLISPHNADEFSLSDIVFSRQTRKIAVASETLERELIQDRIPLVSRGVEFIPSGTTQFRKDDELSMFIEIYEPLALQPTAPKVAVQYVVIDRNTKELKLNTGLIDVSELIEPGNPVIAAGFRIPLQTLAPGSYHLELRASDSARRSALRSANFELQ